MLKTQEAKLNMYNAVIAYSDASTAITAAVAAYATTLTALKAKQAAIVTTAQGEEQVISGITVNKSDLKKTSCNSATTVAAAGFAYATSISDAVLQAKFNYAYSDLFRLKDDELPLILQNIHDEANTVVASLAPFGVTAGVLTSLQTAIDNYTAKVSAPRNAVAQRKSYKAQLVTLFKETDALLKTQLDKLALQLKATEPDFYLTYKNNRIIIDGPTSTTKAEGTITDSVNAAGLFGVIVTVDGQTYTTTTALDGTFTLLIPVPGIYTIIFAKAGYQTFQAVNIEIKLGETTTLNVQLVPAP
jgi:hypothetical protein